MEHEMYGPEPFLTGLGEAMRFIGVAAAIFCGISLVVLVAAACIGGGKKDASENETDPR